MNTRPFVSSLVEVLEPRMAPASLLAVTDENVLLRFDSEKPGKILQRVAITGLAAGETIEGLDVRPGNSQVYALAVAGTTGRLYRLNPVTGGASAVGVPFTVAGTDFGMDFDPVLDRVRVVSSADINLSVSPETGIATPQTDLPAARVITAAAYDANYFGAAETQLFTIDVGTDSVYLQNPSAGTQTLVGALGVGNVEAATGFDIAADGRALASLRVGGETGLYRVNLSTGTALLVGKIGDGTATLQGLAFAGAELRVVNAKTATYVDVDGDRVTVKVSKGSLSYANLVVFQRGAGGQLGELNLSGGFGEFEGANLTVSAKRAGLGDGRVAVGRLEAGGIDLGTVLIQGDLDAVQLGDTDDTDKAFVKFTVDSIGRYQGATRGAAEQGVNFHGAAGHFVVLHDVWRSVVTFKGPNGEFTEGGGVASLKIGGSLLGSRIALSSHAGPVTIGGNIEAGSLGGGIGAQGNMASLTVKGSLLGGGISPSFGITFIPGGGVGVGGELGPVKIGGNVIGSLNPRTGSIVVTGGIASISVGGSIIGGSENHTGSIFSGGDMGKVSIKGSLIGGAMESSVQDLTFAGAIRSGGRIASVTIGGSVLGGTDLAFGGGAVLYGGAILAREDIGAIVIRGDLRGLETFGGTSTAMITAGGQSGLAPNAKAKVAIRSLTVGGQVAFAQVLAGYDEMQVAVNGDASIGAVKVGRGWKASDLVAGIAANAGGFGDGDDSVIAAGNTPGIVARIASVTIKGTVSGSANEARFGFVAQEIGSFSAGGTKLKLTADEAVLKDRFELSPLTGDVTVREV